MLNVNVKRTHPDAVLPHYAHDGDSGFDLVCVEDVIVEPGQTVRVRTGLAFEISHGTELQVRPRSGVSSKTKLRVSNSPGTVDATYRGEVMVLVDNISSYEYNSLGVAWGEFYQTIDGTETQTEMVKDWVDTFRSVEYYQERRKRMPIGTYIIRKGDRIAQGVIAPVIHAQLTEVDDLSDTSRGDNGFASTGYSVT